MVSLQSIQSKRTRQKGRGHRATFLWRVQFYLGKKHHTIRIGRQSKTDAETIAHHFDHLIRCFEKSQAISPETQAWLQSAPRTLVKKLHTLGLCREFTNPTIADYSKLFIDRKKCKETTKTNLRIAH